MYRRDDYIEVLKNRSNFPTLSEVEYELFSEDILALIDNYDIILKFLFDNDLLDLFFNFIKNYED